jgi:hypothetical protein
MEPADFQDEFIELDARQRGHRHGIDALRPVPGRARYEAWRRWSDPVIVAQADAHLTEGTDGVGGMDGVDTHERSARATPFPVLDQGRIQGLEDTVQGDPSRRAPLKATRFKGAVTNGMWRSLAARLLWEQEVRGSNPRIPTRTATRLRLVPRPAPATRRARP